MLQEAPHSVIWSVLRGRFVAPQDEGGGSTRISSSSN